MEKEYLEDLVNELELMDDDDVLRYKIGDSFLSLPLESVKQRLEIDSEKCNAAVKDLQLKLKNILDEMSGLKSLLYSKFGKSINLEF
jgi:prefoldin subunit 4